jgi:hypothetical protein
VNAQLKPRFFDRPDLTLKSFVEDVYLPFYQRKWKASTAMTNKDRIQREIVTPLGLLSPNPEIRNGSPRYGRLGIWSGTAKVVNGKIQFPPRTSEALRRHNNTDARRSSPLSSESNGNGWKCAGEKSMKSFRLFGWAFVLLATIVFRPIILRSDRPHQASDGPYSKQESERALLRSGVG